MATTTGSQVQSSSAQDVDAFELQVNTSNAEPSGCGGFESIHESTQVQTLRKSLAPLAGCWQAYEQFRYSCVSCCAKKPFACLAGKVPTIGGVSLSRFSISDILWTIFLIFIPIFQISEALDEVDSDAEGSFRWYQIGLACGEIATVNYAFLWMFSQRNTLVNLIFGIPFERAIKYHRYLGWYAIFWSWMHFILITQYWLDTDSFNDSVAEEHSISGLIMLGCVSMIFIFTINFIRRNYWELFLKTHWVLFCIFLWAAIKHDQHFSTQLFLAALIMWFLDLLWRAMLIFLWGKPGVVQNIELKPGGVIKVTWKNDDFIYEGGQYAFICIPAIDLTQWHPFSISSSPDDDENHFHIRALGDFTKQLEFLSKQNVSDWSRLQVYMEGPYGRLEIPLTRYDSIVLISGGIGITPMQSVWGDLMSLIAKGKQYKEIHFVWYIRDPKMVDEFDSIHWKSVKRIGAASDQFRSNLKINGTLLKTTYIFTKVKDGSNEYNTLKQRFGDGFVNGRPHCKELIDMTTQNQENGNVAVLGCGPQRMLEDIKTHCVGNHIDYHTEVFTF